MPIGRNPLILLSGLIMLLGGWFAWNHHRQSAAAGSSLASNSDWQKRAPAPARKIAEHPNPMRSAPETESGALPAAAPSVDAPGIPADPGADAALAGNSAPDAATLETYYNNLFRRLNFTPEQIAQFRALREQAILDALNALPLEDRERLANSPAAMRQMTFNSPALEDHILQQFGDVVYAQYKQDRLTFSQRVTVDRFDQTLRASGSGLSDDQANQLVQILTQTQTSNFSPEALNAAAAILTPEQLQALQHYQESGTLNISEGPGSVSSEPAPK